MKKIVFISFFAVSLFSLCSCNNKNNAVTLVMSEPNPSDSISARMDDFFVRKVDELSGGNIKITLHVDGVLGDNTSVMRVMTQPNSEIHIARVSPASLTKYGCTKHELLDIPFTFSSRGHFWRFATSKSAQEILDEPYTGEKSIGVKGLFFAEEGFRHFFSSKELNGISDFNGKKIRTAGNAAMNGIISSLGGEAVAVSYSNLYSALQTGIVDIAEQPIENYHSSHFNKIAPYMILDGHQLGLTEVIITAKAWDSLSKKQQEILLEAGKLAGEYCSKITQEAEQNARKQLEDEGTAFVEVKNISEWQKTCADLINSFVHTNTQLYGEIITLAD